jgi:hypothetical protein
MAVLNLPQTKTHAPPPSDHALMRRSGQGDLEASKQMAKEGTPPKIKQCWIDLEHIDTVDGTCLSA